MVFLPVFCRHTLFVLFFHSRLSLWNDKNWLVLIARKVVRVNWIQFDYANKVCQSKNERSIQQIGWFFFVLSTITIFRWSIHQTMKLQEKNRLRLNECKVPLCAICDKFPVLEIVNCAELDWLLLSKLLWRNSYNWNGFSGVKQLQIGLLNFIVQTG